MCRQAPARWRASVGPDGDLDLVPVRVLEKGRVGTRAVGAALAGLRDHGAAAVHAACPSRLDGDDPERGEAEQAKARLRLMVEGDEEDGFGDAPTDRFVLLEVAPPAERGKQRVEERATPIEVGNLQ